MLLDLIGFAYIIGGVQEQPNIVEIIQQAQAGSEPAFEIIVKNYQQMVFWLAYRMLGDRGLADDVTQETFLRVYKSLGRFDTTRSFATWLRQIAVNLSIDYQRRYKNRPVSLSAIGDIMASGADAEKSEDLKRIRELVDRLPEKYKTVLVLKDIEGLDTKEIAEIVRRPMVTVRWRLFKARQMIRARLKPKI